MTVAELVDALQFFPPDMIVTLRDADTEWSLRVMKVEAIELPKAGKVVELSGDYGDEIE